MFSILQKKTRDILDHGGLDQENILNSLREKFPDRDVFSGPYFPIFGLNTGKFGPEKSSYLDTFHEVPTKRISTPQEKTTSI